jgi:2-isopropylmalate synthase
MPYLPIDPKDLGRSYDAVIRVNSQSGKGGIAYLLENEYGLELPRRLQIEFSQVVQAVTDVSGKELGGADIRAIFDREYWLGAAPSDAVAHASIREVGEGSVAVSATVNLADGPVQVVGRGAGPIDAFVAGLNAATDADLRVLDYHEHAIGSGADARAVAYLELRVADQTLFGVGIDANIVSASLKAIVSGLLRAQRRTTARVADGTAVS